MHRIILVKLTATGTEPELILPQAGMMVCHAALRGDFQIVAVDLLRCEMIVKKITPTDCESGQEETVPIGAEWSTYRLVS